MTQASSNTSLQHPLRTWVGLGGSTVTLVASLWIVITAPTLPIRCGALVASLGSAATLGVHSLNQGHRDHLKETIAIPATQGHDPTSSQIYPEYNSCWTIRQDPAGRQFTGKATLLDFGDRVVIRQKEDARGTYILDLKQLPEGNLSGVWWFYGSQPAHGVYQGKISTDKLEIVGTWQQPGGQRDGNWSHKADPSE